MPSYLGWLDYSEKERQSTLNVIDLFREHDTRDELGIGTVRDALADLLFPGTTTIQTRARYFLFVPWVMKKLEIRRIPSSKAANEMRSLEVSLIASLLKQGESTGVIGSTARATLKRLPSSVYWQGLAVWGIRLFRGSISQYQQSLDAYYRFLQRKQTTDDGTPINTSSRANWHGGLPEVPTGFPWEPISLTLNGNEAYFLRDRVVSSVGRTLLSYLLDCPNQLPTANFPWEVTENLELPLDSSRQVTHAQNLSQVMHGAALLYNLMLAEQAASEELIEQYHGAIDEWIAGIESRGAELSSWDHMTFWKLIDNTRARVPTPTRAFINQWLTRSSQGLDGIAVDTAMRQMLKDREWSLKHSQARLFSPRALELWSGSAGAGRLDFRWLTVQQIITDIREGLNG